MEKLSLSSDVYPLPLKELYLLHEYQAIHTKITSLIAFCTFLYLEFPQDLFGKENVQLKITWLFHSSILLGTYGLHQHHQTEEYKKHPLPMVSKFQICLCLFNSPHIYLQTLLVLVAELFRVVANMFLLQILLLYHSALPEQKAVRLILPNYKSNLSCKNRIIWPGTLQCTAEVLINLGWGGASVRTLATSKSETEKNTIKYTLSYTQIMDKNIPSDQESQPNHTFYKYTSHMHVFSASFI